MMKILSVPCSIVLAAFWQPGLAHHSTAIFDMNADVELTGIITRYEWANPHVYLWLETRNDAGTVIVWEVEAGPPAILRRSGISRDQIAVGDEITVHGKAGRVAAKRQVLMNSLTRGGSGTLNFGQAGAVASIMMARESVTQPATSLAGTWASLLDMSVAGPLITPPRDLLTASGEQAVEDIRQGLLPDVAPCTPATAPSMMMAPDIKLVSIAADEVRISREYDGVTRVIDMRAGTHDGAEPSEQGHAIGRWEGAMLVIDTARFTANPRGNGYLLPSSEQKHLVERLRLNDTGTHLLYSFILSDPAYLAAPIVSGEVAWTHRPDLRYEPSPCDSENAVRHTR